MTALTSITTWIDRQRIMLIEKSQSQNVSFHFFTVLFHLHDILEMPKLQQQRTGQWLFGFKEGIEGQEVSVVLKGQHEDGHVLYPDCINVNILSVIILYYYRYTIILKDTTIAGNQVICTGNLSIFLKFNASLKLPQNKKFN